MTDPLAERWRADLHLHGFSASALAAVIETPPTTYREEVLHAAIKTEIAHRAASSDVRPCPQPCPCPCRCGLR